MTGLSMYTFVLQRQVLLKKELWDGGKMLIITGFSTGIVRKFVWDYKTTNSNSKVEWDLNGQKIQTNGITLL